MALTLEVEQRLKKVDLVAFFDKHHEIWESNAKDAYAFVLKEFPKGAAIRPDDVAKALIPVVEVNAELQDFLSAKKLTQKYWFSDFTDLILDRTWNSLHG